MKTFKPLPQLPNSVKQPTKSNQTTTKATTTKTTITNKPTSIVSHNKDDDEEDFIVEKMEKNEVKIKTIIEPKKTTIRSIKVNSQSVVDMNNNISNEEIIIKSGHKENEWDIYFREYEKYEKQFGKIVLLYQIGEFYEIYGVDNETEQIGHIWEIAEIASLNFSKVGIGKFPNIHENDRTEHPLKGGFQLNSYHDFVPKFLKHGFTVVEIIQTGRTTVMTDSFGKNRTEKKERKLNRIITPSTFIDEIDETGSSYAVSVFIGLHTRESQKNQIKQKGWKECVFSIGMSALDWSTNGSDGIIYEAHDKSYDSTYAMNELYRFIHSISPKEIFITYNSSFTFDEEAESESGDYVDLTEESFIDFLNKELSLKKFRASGVKQVTKEHTNNTYQIALLEKVFGNHGMIPVIDYLQLDQKQHATTSFVQLLQFAYERDSKILNGLEKPQLWENDKHLILSNNALYQLHVVGSKTDESQVEQQGLYDILNKTKTAMGKRLLKYDILNPIVNESELEMRYKIIEIFMRNGAYTEIRKFLGYMSDIEKLYRHLELGMIRPNMLAKLNSSHEDILVMIDWMKEQDELNEFWDIEANYVITDETIEKLREFVNRFGSLFDNEKMQACSQINKVEESFFKVGSGFDEIDRLQEEINDNKDSLGTFTSVLSKMIDPDSKNEAISIKKLATNAKTKKEVYALNCTKPRFRLVDHYLKAIEECQDEKKMIFRYESARAFDKFSKRCDDEENMEIRKPGKNDPVLSEKEITFLESICQINREKLKTNVQFQSSYLNDSKDDASELFIQMNEAMKKAYKEILISFTKEYIPYCHFISQFISRLDIFTNHAFTATEYKYSKPIISTYSNFCKNNKQGNMDLHGSDNSDGIISEERSFIKARKVRHPIIERLLSRTTFIPNDITIGCEDTNGILLFGINNVGKTSYLRSVGLNILMAQTGSFVPADEFVYYPFINILTRLSGGDNMHKGQGIYEVEMSELRDITHRCSFRSIVLADELCHGTEQVSANGIVTGGIKYLGERTNFILATHLHDTPEQPELQKLSNIKCMHLKITRDPKTNRIAYDRTLQPGPGESDYGIEVARSMGIPEEILIVAEAVRKRYLSEEEKIVSTKRSRYSADVFMKSCINCGKKSEETHHIIEQAKADESGFLGHYHKNTQSNLLPLCEDCHRQVTYGQLEILPPVMTTEGIIVPVSKKIKNI